MLRRVENGDSESAEDIALMLFRTATLRSGFMLLESEEFANSVDQMMRKTLGIENEEMEDEVEEIPETGTEDQPEDTEDDQNAPEHEEL